MTPLERYNAYKASKGLSETAETVTKPQNYNVRSGGVSAIEKKTLDDIITQQAKTREANRIQSEKFWRITTAKKEDVPKIILSQPSGANTSKGNLAEYFDQQGIDPLKDPIDPFWDKPIKQTELREKLREKAKTPYQKLNTAQPETQQTTIAREGPRGQTKEQAIIQQIPDVNPVGRVVMPVFETTIPEQVPDQVPEQVPDKNNEKLFLVGGLGAIVILGFFIIRRMKK